MMKTVFQRVIAQHEYDLPAMLSRIDEYHIAGKLTAAERDELIAAARKQADPASGMDVAGEIQRLWAAIRELQGSSVPADAPEFIQPTGVHDAYYAGDRVLFDGTVYTCIAPPQVACVWSPATMPDYWQAS